MAIFNSYVRLPEGSLSLPALLIFWLWYELPCSSGPHHQVEMNVQGISRPSNNGTSFATMEKLPNYQYQLGNSESNWLPIDAPTETPSYP